MPKTTHLTQLTLLAIALTPDSAFALSIPVADAEIVHVDTDYTSNPDFGAAIAGRNGTVVVGAPLKNTDASMAGQAMLFRSLTITDVNSGLSVESWQKFRLTPGTSPSVRSFCKFGTAVALSDDVLAVGAPGWWGDGNSKSGSGAVMLYDIGWSTGAPPHLATLEQPSPEVGDHFGAALASDNMASVSTTRFAIGAPGLRTPDSNISNAGGAVYMYQYDTDSQTWINAAFVQPSDVQADDEFGFSVTIAGDFLVVGAPAPDRNGARGKVYVFHYDDATSSWNQTAVINGADTTCTAQFGRAVELWFNRLVIGGQDHASLYYLNDTDAVGTIDFSQTLEPDATASTLDWGCSVSIDYDRILVGSKGHVGLFRRGIAQSYNLLARLNASQWDGDEGQIDVNDNLGSAVTVRGTQAWAGAPNVTAEGTGSGAAVRWNVRGMPGCPADIDLDYDVDSDDMLILLTSWHGSTWGISDLSDVNEDDSIDIHDLIEVLTSWGSCS